MGHLSMGRPNEGRLLGYSLKFFSLFYSNSGRHATKLRSKDQETSYLDLQVSDYGRLQEPL
jgi:hypothetical protein